MHSGLDRRTVRQDMAPSQEELATSSGHYALGPWDAGRQQQRRLRRGGQSGGRDPNQGCCPQPPPLPGRWEVKEGGGHRDNVFRPLLGGAVPWRPGWGEEGKPGVRLEGLWRGWGGGSAGGVCSEVRGWPLPCARLGRTGDRMEALRPGGEKSSGGGRGLCLGAGGTPSRAQCPPTRWGPPRSGSHRPGPRRLLSQAQVAPEAGTDHQPLLRPQLRVAEPVRRGLPGAEPASSRRPADAWVSRLSHGPGGHGGGHRAPHLGPLH